MTGGLVLKIKFPIKRLWALASIILLYSVVSQMVSTCNDYQQTLLVKAENKDSTYTEQIVTQIVVASKQSPLMAEYNGIWKADISDYSVFDEFSSQVVDNTIQVSDTQPENEQQVQNTPQVTESTTTTLIQKISTPEAFQQKLDSIPLNPKNDVGGSNPPAPHPEITMTVIDNTTGQQVTLSAYQVLCSLLQQELNNAHPEALKAQAVASYTYYKYYEQAFGQILGVNLKSDSQVYQSVKDAVNAVIGVAMYDSNGNYIFSPYCASTGGATASCADVWGGYRSYLVSVPSEYDNQFPWYYSMNANISQSQLKSKIENYWGITLPEDPSKWFEFLPVEQGGVLSGGFVGKMRIYKSA